MGARSTGSHSTTTKADGHLLEYFRQTFGAGGGGTNATPPPLSGLTATGGVISDYTDPGSGNVYRAHIFTSSGAFNVTAPGDFGDTVEYLVVAGGGAGGSEGSQRGGGGGAGGFRTNVPGTPGDHTTTVAFPVSVSPYPVVVGSGGAGGPSRQGTNGADSSFGPITSNGGGGGGQGSNDSPPANEGQPGGSGGGGGSTASTSATEPGGSTIAVTTPSPWPGPSTQGFAGGTGQHVPGYWAGGGGGGGAGGAGGDATDSSPGGTGTGGVGLRSLIAGPGPTGAGQVGTPGPGPTTGGWFAGGGAGVFFTGGPLGPAAGGGGIADYPNQPVALRSGVYATGGGGASAEIGGNGGSGIVVVRYQIAQLTAEAKATGGAITAYAPDSPSPMAGYTVHTFLGSGTFTNTSGSTIPGALYLVVGGGGSGAGANIQADGAAGGGAGGLLTNHPECPAPLRGGALTLPTSPVTVTVGAGGRAAALGSPAIQGAPGFISSFGPTLIASGGGGGRIAGSGDGDAGGSGGGSSGGSGAGVGGAGNTWTPDAPGYPGTAGSPPQGHAGGDNGPNFGSGGGGGFISVGSDSPLDNGGPGGTGIDLTISGVSIGYAGGGGGGAAGPYRGSYSGGSATHGGGAGANADTTWQSFVGGDGTMNTGGGGGGGGGGPAPGVPDVEDNRPLQRGGGGGSGIVIIAYPS